MQKCERREPGDEEPQMCGAALQNERCIAPAKPPDNAARGCARDTLTLRPHLRGASYGAMSVMLWPVTPDALTVGVLASADTS